MNKNDFRYLRRGKPVCDLKKNDFSLIKPIDKHGKKADRALLLLHGFLSSPAVYRYIIPQLKHYDAIVCPALPGHGKSIATFAQATAVDWIECVSKTCEELFEKYNKVDVVGFSLGGLLACKLSERFAFNHLFLLAPALKLSMNVKANLKLAKLLTSLGFKEIRNTAGNMLTNEHAEISYRRIPLPVLSEMFNFFLQYRWVAPNCPVDLFLGTHDVVVPSLELEEMFSHLPNVSIHRLENSAHILPLDNDLNQIAECINNS